MKVTIVKHSPPMHSVRHRLPRGGQMKLQTDLVRDLLLYVEENATRTVSQLDDVRLDGWSEDQIAYHVCLAEEDGLIRAQIAEMPDEVDPHITHVVYSIERLTSKGHESLSTIRDKEIWAKTKAAAKNGGVEALSFVWDVAKAVAKKEFEKRTDLEL